jgi:hypothetical protein
MFSSARFGWITFRDLEHRAPEEPRPGSYKILLPEQVHTARLSSARDDQASLSKMLADLSNAFRLPRTRSSFQLLIGWSFSANHFRKNGHRVL